MGTPQVGQVAWYVTGRFYGPQQGLPLDAGYFLYIAGNAPSLFSGTPSEATAYFTFSADPISATPTSNGNLSLSLDEVGKFTVYLQTTPIGNFDEPASFVTSQPIAVFQRASLVVGTAQTIGFVNNFTQNVVHNVFSAQLIWSAPFQFQGQPYDFADLIPNGVTQWGMGGSIPSDLLPTYTTITPFVGSAIAMGSAG